MKKLIVICAVMLVIGGSAFGSVTTIQIGDNDGYGYGALVVPDGDDLPYTDDPYTGYGWLFDNRSASELAATDGSQATDIEDNFDVTFSFSFDPNPISADFTIDISGVQQGESGGYSYLYFDGIEVGFGSFYQGTWESDVLVYSVDPSLLADGALDVYFDNYTTNSFDDHIAIDYVSLTVTPIPAPGAILLGGIGVGLVGWLRRQRTL